MENSRSGTGAPIPELPFGNDIVCGEATDTENSTSGRKSEQVASSKEALAQEESEGQLVLLDGPLRVKHHPKDICFIHDGYAFVRDGFYSGALDDTGDMHGNGVFWFATTNDLYLGNFSHGELHGIGALSIRLDEDETRKSKRPKTRILKGHWEHNEFMGEETLSY